MASLEEGKDVQLLRALCKNTFEKIAKSVSEERFLELLRGFVNSKSKSKSKVLKLYDDYQSTLVERLNECLNDLIEEENLDNKFSKRAELLQKQQEFEGTTAWRPTGDPLKDVRSHDMQSLIQIKTAMEEYLLEKEPLVDVLVEKVRRHHKEASNIQTTINKMLDKNVEENAHLDEFEEGHCRILKALAPLTHESVEK